MSKSVLQNPKGYFTVKVVGGDRFYLKKEEGEALIKILEDEETCPDRVKIKGSLIKTAKIDGVIDWASDNELINEI